LNLFLGEAYCQAQVSITQISIADVSPAQVSPDNFSPPSPPRIRVTEIPRRINSTDIFTLKGDDFENLIPNEWVTLRAMQALKLCSDAQDKPVMASN
jgi:hypothetical protein